MSLDPEINTRLDGLSAGDQMRFSRRLFDAYKISDRRRREKVVEQLAGEISRAHHLAEERLAGLPERITYPAELPITDRRNDVLAAIRDHQVVIVAGETGSGKSTQIPKLCLELGRGAGGLIGHTQPRRIAARSIAERIAEELHTTVGAIVGYTVRFTDEVSDRTLIRLMTDGILLNEIQRDRMLSRYDTIIIDEAHERSLNIDFLLGYLKQLLPQRPDLKLIITSATIDTVRFAEHFDGAPVVEVAGRTYPVEIRYRPLDDPALADPIDQTDGICAAVRDLQAEGRGDILVFCSGEREIRDAVGALEDLDLRDTEILPLYGRLSAGEQHRIFAPARGRRIVVATNVAETSLTVPGIRYVVDPGAARISRYNRRTKVQRLPIEPISQASANQRAGRCGRLGPGIAIRLYSSDDYLARPEFTDPEILRTSLASVILQMAAIGLGDIKSFPFLDPPDTRAIRDGIALLEELGAVDAAHHGSPAWLTEMGRRLARLPVDPRLARIIIEGDRKGCLREVLIIAAALAIQDPRERPAGREQSADRLHRRFADKDSDFLTWINLWEYLREGRRERTSSQFRRLCRDEFLNYRRVREWQDVHAQLRDVAKDLGLRRNRVPADRESVLRALMAGFLSHIGHKQPDGHEYNGARGARFAISPASSLFKANPEWVMAAELVETKRLWAHAAARIDPAWAEDVGAAFTKRSYSDPWWDPDRGAAVAAETVTLFGLTLVAGRTVQFGRVDPGAARRLFIEHVLVAGEWHTHHDFVTHNAAKINEVLALEARGRRSDLLVDDETVVAFFDARLPADVVSVRHFDRWWKEERLARPDLLKLTTDDLIAPDADSLDDQAFPHVWSYGDLDLPLSYEFDPQSHSDGVTIDLPVSALERIDPAAFDWLVPGLRRELVETLIRSLPKQVRKQFVPIPDTAASLVDDLEPADGGLVESLRRELTRRSGTAILSDAFDLDALPHHLKPKFRIVDGAGSELAVGDDLGQLRRELRDTARSAITGASHELERSGLLTWSIGDLPRTLPLVGAGSTVDAYPALVDEGDAIAVRLLATPAEQADAMWSGTRRLLLLQLPSISTLLRPLLSNDLMLALAVSPYESPSEWMSDIASAAVGELMVDGDAPAWNGQEFERLLAHVRTEFGERAETMARTSANALQVLRRVRGLLNGDFGASFPEPAIDIGNQLDRFIYPGFLTGVGAGRVEDVARYLQAIERRVARIPEDPAKDRDLMYRIVVLERELDYLMDRLPWSEDMIDLAWMLQELRVSVFAQQLGVKGPVSEKRIRRGLDRLTGLAD